MSNRCLSRYNHFENSHIMERILLQYHLSAGDTLLLQVPKKILTLNRSFWDGVSESGTVSETSLLDFVRMKELQTIQNPVRLMESFHWDYLPGLANQDHLEDRIEGHGPDRSQIRSLLTLSLSQDLQEDHVLKCLNPAEASPRKCKGFNYLQLWTGQETGNCSGQLMYAERITSEQALQACQLNMERTQSTEVLAPKKVQEQFQKETIATHSNQSQSTRPACATNSKELCI